SCSLELRTFGFDLGQTAALEYWKAFSTADGGPRLGEATGLMISGFVISAAIEDVERLNINDICTASGQGKLKISAGFKVTAEPNPLASLSLPLNAGKLDVKTGVMAGLSASYTISGSYHIRVRRTSPDAMELSFLKQQGATLTADLSASG